MRESAIGTSHGKLILMGEHAVVHQAHAIALPFEAVRVRVTITPTTESAIQLACTYYHGDLRLAPLPLANLQVAVQQVAQHITQLVSHIRITIDSDIPQERGMGSSAAVVVALVRALCRYYDLELSLTQLHAIVNIAETQAHGTTSGIDTLMTSTHSPIIYQKGHVPQAFDMQLSAYLVVADSGQTGRIRQAVQHVQQLLAQDKNKDVAALITRIDDYVQAAYQAIRTQDVAQLGQLMTLNHHALQQLGVSTESLDAFVDIALQHGACGAKLTGGGLGGCMIALTHTAQDAQHLMHTLEQYGATATWCMPLSPSHTLNKGSDL